MLFVKPRTIMRFIKCVRHQQQVIARAAKTPSGRHNNRSSGRRDAAISAGGNLNKARRWAWKVSSASGVYHDECENVYVLDWARLYLFLVLIDTPPRFFLRLK